MKSVALPVGSPSLDVRVEPRFRRSAFLLLVDPENLAWESVENPGWTTQESSGVPVAQILGDRKVSDLVCGEIEAEARDALLSAGIVPHRCECGTTVRQAVARLTAGELPEDFWT